MSLTAFVSKQNFTTKNAMASRTMQELLKVRKQTIRDSFSLSENDEHRLENVLKINGVQYINDSKAVNVNATYYALESMEHQTVWIVGGLDKGNDYHSLLPLVREKVKAIICLGEHNFKLLETFENVVEYIIETTDLDEAVQFAYRLSEKGDSVLLSPACASHDQFEDYQERGWLFKRAVRNL